MTAGIRNPGVAIAEGYSSDPAHTGEVYRVYALCPNTGERLDGKITVLRTDVFALHLAVVRKLQVSKYT